MGNFPLRNSSMSINWTRCSEEKRRMGGKKGTKVGKGPPPAYLTRRRLCIFFLREIYLASCPPISCTSPPIPVDVLRGDMARHSIH